MAFAVKPLEFMSAMITGAFSGFNFITWHFTTNQLTKTISLITATLLAVAFFIALIKSIDR